MSGRQVAFVAVISAILAACGAGATPAPSDPAGGHHHPRHVFAPSGEPDTRGGRHDPNPGGHPECHVEDHAEAVADAGPSTAQADRA